MRQRRKAAAQAAASGEREGPAMPGATPMSGETVPGGTTTTRGESPRHGGAAPAESGGGRAWPEEYAMWEERTRIFLQPVAAPSILGLFGLAGATMMVGAWQADWIGTVLTPLVMVPFILFFGGLAQLLAGVWSYRARDGLATAVHGMWGAFWLGYSLLFLLVAAGAFPALLAPRIGVMNEGFAMWFVALAAITGLCAVAALGHSMALTLTLTVLAAAAGFTAGGFFSPSTWAVKTGGWLMVATAVLALYVAAALMFENSFGRTVLPVVKVRAAARGVEKGRPLEYRYGEPGVKIGQ